MNPSIHQWERNYQYYFDIIMIKKAIFQKLPLSYGSSFLTERFESPHFETPWHYHKEFEIVLSEKGFGKKFVGNHVSDYQEGDLALIGSNLPHWYRADDSFYQPNPALKPASVVIHFLEDSLGPGFFNLSEMTEINKLMNRSLFGLEFFGDTRQQITALIYRMLEADKVGRLIGLIEILNLMSHSKEYRILSGMGMTGSSLKDTDRMNIVFDYVFKKFRSDINLSEIASLTRLTEPAFCRYFKARTQKTFVDFVNEIRIGHACKLLMETEMNILEICYESGFKNLSNFNRQFRKFMDTNPKEYRKGVLELE